MSSARGSEERAAASSSFAGRGPRRGRDYELETLLPLGALPTNGPVYDSLFEQMNAVVPECLTSSPREPYIIRPESQLDTNMNPGVSAGSRSGLNLPLGLPTVDHQNKQGLGYTMKSPASSPTLKLEEFDRITQQPTLGNSQSTHMIMHGPAMTGDQVSTPPAEDGAEKLPDQQKSMTAVPIPIPRIRVVGSLGKKPKVLHRLITPPDTSTSPNAKPTKHHGRVTRKQAKTRKCNAKAKLTDKDTMLMKTLPSEMHSFFKKEGLWSNAQADSDYMLRLPRPNHKYAALTLVQLATSTSVVDPTFDKTANNEPQEEAFHARPSVKLIIPDVIKALLVDDWENVTKNMQLVPLPHPKPVTKILEDYSAYEMPKRVAGSSHADILEETLSGLREYFDKSLGRILLYKFERPQYAEVHKKWNSSDPEFQGKTASDIYGAEHLCRLIVSLPELIAQTNMDQQSVNRLREELAKFSTWLSKHATEYFVSSYETPAQDYVDKAKN
ncbi:hypothetical protein O1611_g9738 [Lasiodiplodia mahajangana]|uniref:Uncharacterized protein n=1 Tax=Lasiodiplodia mahajangana TaxID=1108764 RepID=A0ACC2J5Z2_9PEZI|nr:hypothetical protein O1611_g9738 [Lasiodiplodia mahajangana]